MEKIIEEKFNELFEPEYDIDGELFISSKKAVSSRVKYTKLVRDISQKLSDAIKSEYKVAGRGKLELEADWFGPYVKINDEYMGTILQKYENKNIEIYIWEINDNSSAKKD